MFIQKKSENYIISNPLIMMGKPIIKGTRITVELLLERLASGESVDQILEAYPHLSKESIYAAIDFASRAMKADVVYPIAS